MAKERGSAFWYSNLSNLIIAAITMIVYGIGIRSLYDINYILILLLIVSNIVSLVYVKAKGLKETSSMAIWFLVVSIVAFIVTFIFMPLPGSSRLDEPFWIVVAYGVNVLVALYYFWKK